MKHLYLYIKSIYIFVNIFLINFISSQSPCKTNEGKDGKCVRISDCPELRLILNQIQNGQNSGNAVKRLRDAVCSVSKRMVLVCCSIQEDFSRHTFQNTQTFHQGQTDCGRAIFADRIVGGVNAGLGEWPWIVQLMGKDTRGKWSQFCGGSLVSNKYAISAAHCFSPTNPIRVEIARIGDYDLRYSIDCVQESRQTRCAPKHQDFLINQIILHPDYKRECRDCNDIAIIRLQGQVQFNDYVQPICIPVEPRNQLGFGEEEFNGKVAKSAGWGSIVSTPNIKISPDVLQQVDLKIQELSFCRRTKTKYPNKNSIICAGSGGGDTCRGDSGGPLVLSNSGGTKYYLVGVTSLGPNICGQDGTQGIYTNVYYYRDWILNNIKG